MNDTAMATTDGEFLACPKCDALYRTVGIDVGRIAECTRCGTVFAAPRRKAGMLIISLSLGALILVTAMTLFPFLQIEAKGIRSATSLLDVALAFSEGYLALLVILTVGVVVAVPALHALLLLVVLTPIVFDRQPGRWAQSLFRLAQDLRHWAMAEVFALSCAVALIKITDLAQVTFGPAFWMFGLMVLFVLLQDRVLCSWSVWNVIGNRRP